MKKGAVAAGALALGAGATTNTAAAQEDGTVLIFSYDYHPGQSFDVVAQLEQSTTVNVLQDDEETVPEISQPDDYTGHVIRYDLNGGAGITAFLFSQDVSMSAGDSGTLGEDASMFSPQLNLLSTSINGNGGDGDSVDDDEDTSDDAEDTSDDAEDTADDGGDAVDENGEEPIGDDSTDENGEEPIGDENQQEGGE